jgi:FlaA1/EpsC-like NDP-sugar epimerase
MGESIKIIDLAKKMIKLSGLVIGDDIEIKITGLRPGEKLYEELLTSEESTLPTHHEQIMIGSVREYDYAIVEKQISELVNSFDAQKNTDIVLKMKEMVPEFKSNNSQFSKLDK